MIWFVPERKVFLDSRQDPFPIEFLPAAFRSGEYEEIFQR